MSDRSDPPRTRPAGAPRAKAEDWSRITKHGSAKADIDAKLRAHQLRRGETLRSLLPNGPAWAHTYKKLEDAATTGIPIELSPRETQHIFSVLNAANTPPRTKRAPERSNGPSQRGALTPAAPLPIRLRAQIIAAVRGGVMPRLTPSLREQLVRALRRKRSIHAIARQFHTSRATVRRWKSRAGEAQNLSHVDFHDQPPGAVCAPPNKIDIDVEHTIVLARGDLIESRRPAGPAKIRAELLRESSERYLGTRTPSERTIARVLARNDLLK